MKTKYTIRQAHHFHCDVIGLNVSINNIRLQKFSFHLNRCISDVEATVYEQTYQCDAWVRSRAGDK